MCKERFGWMKNNLCFSLLEYIVVIILAFSGIQFCCLGKSMRIRFSFLLNGFNILRACVHAKSLQSSPTLCDPMDGSPPGSSVHGVFQQEYWSGLPFPPPRALPDPGNKPTSPALQVDSLPRSHLGRNCRLPLLTVGRQTCFSTQPNSIQLPEFTQTHVHRVSDAIQPSHPLLSPSSPAPNPSQHQGLFQWVNSSHEVATLLLHKIFTSQKSWYYGLNFVASKFICWNSNPQYLKMWLYWTYSL